MNAVARHDGGPRSSRGVKPLSGALQRLLARLARKIAADNPSVFDRIGPHVATRFIIDPVNLPIVLYLEPRREAPVLRAYLRSNAPQSDARIAASLLQLMRMIDGEEDGDAMFFSRDLKVSGNTEAVVALRNALDDLDRPLAEQAAAQFGAAGRGALALARHIAARKPFRGAQP